MKISNLLFTILLFLLSYSVYSQNIITFDNQGWSSDQTIGSSQTIDNFTFFSNKNFYTNYGYNFDVNHVSLYYAFQNPVSDILTITTLDDAYTNLSRLGVYQVGERGVDTLIIEGWNGLNKKYSSVFTNINSWQILTLNYYSINKIIIRSGNLIINHIFDYNFDNISFNDIVDVEPINSRPQSFNLSQNYPNPFNPSTVINYQIPQAGKVIIKIYDILGNEIATLVDEEKAPGNYSVTFSANGGAVGNLSSGIYIYKLSVTGGADAFVSTKKMMLIK